MNNYLAIDRDILEYACRLVEVVSKKDSHIATELTAFIDDVLKLLVSTIEKCSSDNETTRKLGEFANSIKNQWANKSHSLKDSFLSTIEQCKNIAFLSSFVICFADLVAKLPHSLIYSWLLPLFDSSLLHSLSLVGTNKEDAQHSLRLLFQHSMPSLSQYYLPVTDRLLVLDYDGTITTKDTCNVGILGGDLFNNDGRNRASEYDSLLKDFCNVYDKTMNDLRQAPSLEAFLQGYDALDRNSLTPVVSSGLFKGLQEYAVRLVSRLIEFRENVSYAVTHLVPVSDAYVVSQSWYQEMVIESLQHNVHYPTIPIPTENVFTSRLVYADGVATGELDPACAGCLGKKQVMTTIVQRRNPACTVVIGDGLGDLGMMMKADVAVVLTPGTSFREVCDRYHIVIRPLWEYVYGDTYERTIFESESWSEVVAVLGYSLSQLDAWVLKQPSVGKRCTAEQCRLMALTNDALNEEGGTRMERAVLESIRGGATMVQIRDKTENFDRMVEHANQLKDILAVEGIPLIINDRVDVAIVSHADGVHIGQHDMNASLCRRLLGPTKILGVSAQTPEQAIQAEKDGADYLGTGAVYPTISKDDADAVGVEGLRRVCESVDIPVVSIGGVNAQNAGETIEAGAVGIAVISAIFSRPDIREAAHELRTAVDKALSK